MSLICLICLCTNLNICLIIFFPFSLESFGDLEETEWKDTAELYKEKVRKKQTV